MRQWPQSAEQYLSAATPDRMATEEPPVVELRGHNKWLPLAKPPPIPSSLRPIHSFQSLLISL